MEAPQPTGTTFTFASSGWLQIYQLGVARALASAQITTDQTLRNNTRFCGVSTGAIAATVSCAGLPVAIIDEIAEYAVHCSQHYRTSVLNLFSIRDYVQAGVRKFSLESRVPSGEGLSVGEQLVSNYQHDATVSDSQLIGITSNHFGSLKLARLEVYLTKLPKMAPTSVNRFESTIELEEALCATCCMPAVSGLLPMRLKESGSWVIDGSLSTLQPKGQEERNRQTAIRSLRKRLGVIEARASRLSKLADYSGGYGNKSNGVRLCKKDLMISREAAPLRSEIAEFEASESFVSVSPFYFSRAAIRPSVPLPAWWAVYPPTSDELMSVYQLGNNDAVKYLSSRGMDSAVSGKLFLGSTDLNTRGKDVKETRVTKRFTSLSKFLLAVTGSMNTLAAAFIVRPIAISAVYSELTLVACLACIRLVWAVACFIASIPKAVMLAAFEFVRINMSGKVTKARANILSTSTLKLPRNSSVIPLLSWPSLGSYDADFFREISTQNDIAAILATLSIVCSARQLFRLAFNAPYRYNSEALIVSRSTLYRVLQPIIFDASDKGKVFRDDLDELEDNKHLYQRLTAAPPKANHVGEQEMPMLPLHRVASLAHSVASSLFSICSATSMPEEEQRRVRQFDEEAVSDKKQKTYSRVLSRKQQATAAKTMNSASTESVVFGSDAGLSVPGSQQYPECPSPLLLLHQDGSGTLTPAMLASKIALLNTATTSSDGADPRWERSRAKLRMVAILVLQLMINNIGDMRALKGSASPASSRSPSLATTARSSIFEDGANVDSMDDSDGHQQLMSLKTAEVQRQARLLMGIFKATSIALLMSYSERK